MKFVKYHALGNDYIVLPVDSAPEAPDPDQIRRICHRNYGVGSDGILWGPLESETCDFGLRIFNPDGSEAEKSGNGLRIFARFLWDRNRVAKNDFSVDTAGGPVSCRVEAGGGNVTVEMGKVRFHSTDIPVNGPSREVIREEMVIQGRTFCFCGATVGNPHCVVLTERPDAEDARRYGPLIETDPLFPNRTNVQFMQVMDRQNIRIEIWERGAGYTLASGSSSTAAAAVARRLGWCDPGITVHMPGGTIHIQLDADYRAIMTGPVNRVFEGSLFMEAIEGASG